MKCLNPYIRTGIHPFTLIMISHQIYKYFSSNIYFGFYIKGHWVGIIFIFKYFSICYSVEEKLNSCFILWGIVKYNWIVDVREGKLCICRSSGIRPLDLGKLTNMSRDIPMRHPNSNITNANIIFPLPYHFHPYIKHHPYQQYSNSPPHSHIHIY